MTQYSLSFLQENIFQVKDKDARSKIEKLLALAHSSNYNESQIALAKANKIFSQEEKYISDKEDNIKEIILHSHFDNGPSVYYLFYILGKANGCYVYTTNNTYSKDQTLRAIGKEDLLNMLKLKLNYLVPQLNLRLSHLKIFPMVYRNYNLGLIYGVITNARLSEGIKILFKHFIQAQHFAQKKGIDTSLSDKQEIKHSPNIFFQLGVSNAQRLKI